MARRHVFRTWDDYFIPGTPVLRNKFTAPGKPYGEPDAAKLRALEEGAAAIRLEELAKHPIEDRFDYEHMKAIHAYIFQDVYEWAGQERVAPVGEFMSKDGHSYYPAGPPLTAAAEVEYAKLADKNLLRGLGAKVFVDELAESWGEVNVIHSFREGNTRSQFVFYSQLAEQAGYRIDTAAFAPGAPLRDVFVEARFHSQDTGRNDQLAGVLRQAIVPFDSGSRQTPGASSRSSLWEASYPTSAVENTRPTSGPQAARDAGSRTTNRGYGAGQDGPLMGGAKTWQMRARRVEDAIHNVEMEGLTVSATTRADAASYIEGMIDSDELVARTRERYGVGTDTHTAGVRR